MNTSKWTVEATPAHKDGVDYIDVSLLYSGREIKKHRSRLGGYENAVMATFEAEARSYNKAGWEPSYGLWVLSGARILNDSLMGDNGRKVDYPYLRANGERSLCCNGASQFWFDEAGNCFKFKSPEVSHEMNEEEMRQFHELVDTDLLTKTLKQAKMFDREEYAAAKRQAKRGASSRERREEEEQEKLNQWLRK